MVWAPYSVLGVTAVAAVTLYVALHRLGVAPGSGPRSVHRWIAAWCGGSLVLDAARATQYLADDPHVAVLSVRVQLACVFLLSVPLMEVCHRLANEEPPRTLVLAVMALSACGAIGSLAPGGLAPDSTHLWTDALGQRYHWVELRPFQGLLGIYGTGLLAYCLLLLLRSKKLDRTGRVIAASGCALYVAVGLNDQILGLTHASGVLLFEHGFVILAMAFDALDVRRLRILYRSLEGEVATRTSELHEANEALSRAAESARTAAATKSAALANMSHEIRTPLGGIAGITSLLEATTLNPAQRTYVGLLRQSSTALMQIVNDVLDFSRIEAGKLDVSSVDCVLADMVEDLTVQFAERAQAAGLTIAVVVDPALPERVRMNPMRVSQVLGNFVSNAVKFTPLGDVVVRASPRGSLIRFEVTDTGMGIPEDQQSAVFETFTQVDASITQLRGGSGLGLAICKQLAQLMGGAIGVLSELGRGSTFWLELPLTAVPGPEPVLPVLGSVLVVGHQPSTREMLRAQLQALGASVEEVAHSVLPGAILRLSEGLRAIIVDLPPQAAAKLAPSLPDGVTVISLRPMRELAEAKPGLVVLASPTTRRRLREALLAGLRVSATTRVVSAPSLPSRAQRVLLIDDKEINRAVIGGMLQHLGCEVHSVETGAAALTLLEKDRAWAVVFMDCRMPDLDGMEVTRRIREREKAEGLTRLPILALSAGVLPTEREEALEAGMDAYLTKPVNFDALALAISNHVTQVDTKTE